MSGMENYHEGQKDKDQRIINAGYPQYDPKEERANPNHRRLLDDARANFNRCERRLYLWELLEDADMVVNEAVQDIAYGSAIIAMALRDVELVVNTP